MRHIEGRFAEHFAPWDIVLPKEHVQKRRRGKIVVAGWAIWYLFGSDERGEYLDYYAAHRMTSDEHVRIYESGEIESLPAISTMRIASARCVSPPRIPKKTPGLKPSTAKRRAG